jgi:hypothetical protein
MSEQNNICPHNINVRNCAECTEKMADAVVQAFKDLIE